MQSRERLSAIIERLSFASGNANQYLCVHSTGLPLYFQKYARRRYSSIGPFSSSVKMPHITSFDTRKHTALLKEYGFANRHDLPEVRAPLSYLSANRLLFILLQVPFCLPYQSLQYNLLARQHDSKYSSAAVQGEVRPIMYRS